MSELAEVLELLHTSSERWRALRLQGHEWRLLKTFGQAWEHHFAETERRSVSAIRVTAVSDDGKDPEESSEEWRCWLSKPDRARMQFLVGGQTVIAVFIGRRWWSRSPIGFKTNEGELNSSHGVGPVEGLIDPARHISFLQLLVDDRATFLSRPVLLVTALPRIADPDGSIPTFHMLGTGADVYKLVVDAEVGILLRSEAQFRGVAFRVIEVDQVAINEQPDNSLFDPNRLRDETVEQ